MLGITLTVPIVGIDDFRGYCSIIPALINIALNEIFGYGSK